MSAILEKEIIRRGIKILNIGWASLSFLLLAIVTVYGIEYVFNYIKDDEIEKLSTWRLILEITLHVWFIGIITYLVRNLYPLLPWPLDGIYGYQHTKVHEVTSATLFASFLVFFNPKIQEQQLELRKRLFY